MLTGGGKGADDARPTPELHNHRFSKDGKLGYSKFYGDRGHRNADSSEMRPSYVELHRSLYHNAKKEKEPQNQMAKGPGTAERIVVAF